MEKSQNQNKTKQIILRVTEQELDFINQRMALNDYTNRSEFILHNLIFPQKIDKKRMRTMIYEVNKIGVNVMQITRRVNQNSSIGKQLFSELQAINQKLDEVLKEYKQLWL